jgi:glycosyltransferase involved in cell wall biosynthesis
MRFCMVTTFYPPYHFGGDAIFVQALARRLTAEGHEVEVVHCEDAYRIQMNGAPLPLTESDGVVVHRLKSRFGRLSPLITQQCGGPGLKARKLRAILARDFDVVNFHNISLVGGPAVLGMSKVSVNLYTLHEHWLLCPAHILWKNRAQSCDGPQCFRCCLRSGIPPQLWRYTGLIRSSLANVDALLSPSEYTAERHRAAGLTVPVRVLPTFSSLDPGGLVKRSNANGRPCFLYVGRVTASKGLGNLLEEFAELEEFDLLIAGDGDLRPRLEQEYRRYSHIRFLSSCAQDQLVPLYQNATALILPSLAPEVFPLTVLEALACGTPAIVHDAGGSREAIDKTGGGVVYESRESLRQAIFMLAKDSQLRETLGRRARVGYEQFYSQERYVARYLDMVDEIRKQKGFTLH